MKFVRALDVPSETILKFDPTWRFSKDPKHLRSPPHYTDADAFDKIGVLADAPLDEEIFIEWPIDRFLQLDNSSGEYVDGPLVWKKARVMEHIEETSS